MIKLISFTLLNVVTLYGEEVPQNELQSIYLEALAFVGVFGTMGVISYIYSSRHAKAYTPSKEELLKKEKAKQLKKEKELRVEELSEMLQKELLTQEEFSVLQSHYL